MKNLTEKPSFAASIRRWVGAWWGTLIAGVGFAAVAGVTGRASYVHIETLSLMLHEPAGIARLMPFGVDGLIVVGSVVLLQAADEYWWLGWVCVVPGAALSLVANFFSFIRYGWASAAWAASSSLGFGVVTFVLERWLKSRFRRKAAEVAHQEEEAAHQATTMELLRALLASDSDPRLAFALKLDRNKIRAWREQLEAADQAEPEAVPA